MTTLIAQDRFTVIGRYTRSEQAHGDNINLPLCSGLLKGCSSKNERCGLHCQIPNSSSSSFSHRPISFHTASGSAGVKDTRPNKPTSTTGLNEIVDCGQSQLEGNYCLALLEIEILCWQNQHLLNQIQHFVNLNAARFTSKYIGEAEKFVGTFLRGKGTRLSFFFFFFLSDSLLCE
ncbi:hypothetical protein AB205_0157900 [Aquarana catesbeiana]|uniref:Uncharacterized protein n=1 Tax=Aquarana catesbeiana TaxID=8400 RepID=A0A2G9RI28_AQUCT|nr:hypothetical protein AB205_0157900 [Aquarana catesbeiana]